MEFLHNLSAPLRHSESKLTSLTVPKNRRPKFDVHLKIIDLNNIPYVSGKSSVKWHLQHTTTAEHRGRTATHSIKEHKVIYDYENTTSARLVIDKGGMLQESWIIFEVFHEVSAVPGGKSERIKMGTVRLNLAEYVEASEQEGEDGVCRRYLMQDSKINSTLKITIFMRQVEGDRNFTAPQLRQIPVFTGISGIIMGEQVEAEETGHMPAVTTKSREAGDELRELYRKTLAAEWTCQPGELHADKCIEDIFSGGDGWGDKLLHHDSRAQSTNAMSNLKPSDDSASLNSLSDAEARNFKRSQHGNWQGFFRNRQDIKRSSREILGKQSAGVKGRGSFEHQAHQMKGEVDRDNVRTAHELDEFDLRDDLRSWKIPI